MKSILYITHDGITDHIGRSQIAPYLFGLAKRGYSIHVLSVEKPNRQFLIEEYQQKFAQAGIAWTTIEYSNRFSFLSFLWELRRLQTAAEHIIRADGICAVHCRCFPATLVGERLKRSQGVKLIFDFRDFWPDTRLETRRFKLPYRFIKAREPVLVRAADKIVCLTERAKNILVDRHLRGNPQPESRFKVIPCCADFKLFDPAAVTQDARERARDRVGVKTGQYALLYLGSLGADYLLREMLRLFAQVLALRPDACFVFVSNNGRELVDAECAALGLPTDAIRFVSADRTDVPAFLTLADLSVVFIRPSLSKAGCSPTKLAELFACGVPVIANTGVGDLDQIVSLEKNGSAIVHDFSDNSLRQAVLAVEKAKTRSIPIRANSTEFTLEAGVDRYASVYAEVLEDTGHQEVVPC